MTPVELERFEAKVFRDPQTGCWLWTAYKNPKGYGRFRTGKRLRVSHQVAFEHWRGPIPDGLQLDHLCRVRHCVNPSHLEAVTGQINVLRGISPAAYHAKKTHCPKGHPYSGDNLYVVHGSRVCRACGSEHMRKWYLKKLNERKA